MSVTHRLGVTAAVAGCLLGGQALFATQASAGLSYLGKLHTSGRYALASPLGATTDGDRNIYVVDSANYRVIKFTPDGDPALVFGKGHGSDQGQPGHLFYPSQAAWSKTNGLIYVADAAGQDIQVFTTAGAFVRKWGSAGFDDGQVSLPTGITVDCSGNVYVANAQPPNDVEEFTATGTFVRRFGTGHVGVATGVVATSYSNTSCDSPDVVVADEYDGKLVQFDSSGNFIRDIGSEGTGHLQFGHPDQLAVRTDGNGTHIWVAESGNYRVQEITTHNEGSTWAYTTQIKKGADQIIAPHGVAVDKKGHIFAVSTGGNVVYEYKNTAPALTLKPATDGRSHIKSAQALTFVLTYNQLGQTCKVAVKATVTVPPHADHVFTVSKTGHVSNDPVAVAVPLSDRQLHWMKQAWADDRKVAVAAKAHGCLNNDVVVSKSAGFSV